MHNNADRMEVHCSGNCPITGTEILHNTFEMIFLVEVISVIAVSFIVFTSFLASISAKFGVCE